MFGVTEAAADLAAGASPVLVEGPMDALAITLGSNNDAVGIAPMGTALTVNQIKLLRATNLFWVNTAAAGTARRSSVATSAMS